MEKEEKNQRCARIRDSEISDPSNGGRIRPKIASQIIASASEKESSFLHPSRLSRNSEEAAARVTATLREENRKCGSPEKEERYYTTRGSVGDENGKGSMEGVGDENRGVVWPKMFVNLSIKEKEEDFLAMKGCKLPQRPKKRDKFIQRTLLLVSPGARLSDMCQERYEVKEKKSSKKTCEVFLLEESNNTPIRSMSLLQGFTPTELVIEDISGFDQFPDDLRIYLRDRAHYTCLRRIWEDSGSCHWLFWGNGNQSQLPVSVHPQRPIVEMIKSILTDVEGRGDFLVRFWVAIDVEQEKMLTIENQPFGLNSTKGELYAHGFVPGLSAFGVKSEEEFDELPKPVFRNLLECTPKRRADLSSPSDVEEFDKIMAEENQVLLSRVFLYERPECIPEPRVYPLRNGAVCSRITATLAFPLFGYWGECVGVIEIVTNSDRPTKLFRDIVSKYAKHLKSVSIASGGEIGGDLGMQPEEAAKRNDEKQTGETSQPLISDSSVNQDISSITIKAKFGADEIIKFELPVMSGMREFQRQVEKRLDLKDGTYSVRYQDDKNDSIIIICDEDLQNYMLKSKAMGRSTVIVSLQPITN